MLSLSQLSPSQVTAVVMADWLGRGAAEKIWRPTWLRSASSCDGLRREPSSAYTPIGGSRWRRGGSVVGGGFGGEGCIMNPQTDKLVRRTTMVATATASYFLLTADYGSEPNALDPLTITGSLSHNWLGNVASYGVTLVESVGVLHLEFMEYSNCNASIGVSHALCEDPGEVRIIQGSTSTAKTPPYPYRVPRVVRILPGYRCMRTPGVPVFGQKKNFPVRVGSVPVRGEAKTASFRLKTEASQPLDSILIFFANRFSLLCSLSLTSSTASELGSLSSALCLSLPPPPVSSVLSPLLSVSHFLHRR
uniref:Uncharacterized protein n=1 Tax=Fagus sylvatica TaxID=28930 RepID=A0A2N9FI07_FAGSY